MEYKCNYFLGNNPAKWHTDVPNYESVTLRNLYPGIDLRLSSDLNNQATYEFIATAHADGGAIPLLRGVRGVSSSEIKITFDGVESTSLDSDGHTILQTKWGDMLADINPANTTGLASPRFVASESNAPSRAGENQSLSAERSGTLSLAYSTTLGGGIDDGSYGIAVDRSGNAYVTGCTASNNFPTQNPYQTDQGGGDVFVTKFSDSGSGLVYSTYLGGGSTDRGYGIAADGSGNAYVTGCTWSTNFPTQNPYQAAFQGGICDIFVTKLSASGSSLIYSTYLGGESSDEGYDIAVGGSGNAYVTGETWSVNFPTQNPYQAAFQGGICDNFVTKLSASGSNLVYSTYLGGDSYDWGFGIAVDGSDNAYVTGPTESTNFPTQNPYQTAQGDGDVYVTKLSVSGSSLVYSTYLGGGGRDRGYDIAVDGSGNAYVTGCTGSTNYPTQYPYQATFHGGIYDVFVTKLSASGSSLVFSTYLGGAGYDDGQSIAVYDSGNAYVTGRTESTNFPTQNPYQTYQGDCDVFVTKLSASGSNLVYSTYLGGESRDEGLDIVADRSGNAYVTGHAYSTNFPTQNAYQSALRGGHCDVFVTKLTWTPEYACGDVNSDEVVDLLDAVFLINYIFVGGPAPAQLALADLDCSGEINIADIVRIVSYIFWGGPAPCSDCK